MSLGESWRLMERLMTDPASHVAAAVGGWDYSLTRESLVLMSLFDLQHQSKARQKPKPYPRPWAEDGRRRFGKTRMSRQQVIAILAQHGHGGI